MAKDTACSKRDNGRSLRRRRRPAAILAAIALGVSAALVATPASAAEQSHESALRELGVDVPPGAKIEALPQLDGTTIYTITSKAEPSALRPANRLASGQSIKVSDGDSLTTYQALAAACTQSQTMTNPVPSVRTNASGTRYLQGTWTFTRGSGCSSGYTWTAFIRGDHPGGLITVANSAERTTAPGATTTLVMSAICAGRDSKRWLFEMRAWAGAVLIDTPVATRPCNR